MLLHVDHRLHERPPKSTPGSKLLYFQARALFPPQETHTLLGSRGSSRPSSQQSQKEVKTQMGDRSNQSLRAWSSSLHLKKCAAKQRQVLNFCITFSIKLKYAEEWANMHYGEKKGWYHGKRTMQEVGSVLLATALATTHHTASHQTRGLWPFRHLPGVTVHYSPVSA